MSWPLPPIRWRGRLSRLAGVPGPDLIARLDLLRRTAATLPARLVPLTTRLRRRDYAERPGRRLCRHLRPPQALLPVPDLLRPWRHPQTRHGPVALKQTYAAAGLSLTDGELPDHLCVILEFAASVGRNRAPTAHRASRRDRTSPRSPRDAHPLGQMSPTRCRPPCRR